MDLSKRIRAFAGVVLVLSLLPAAYLVGEVRAVKHSVGNTGDFQANPSGPAPLKKLEPPDRKLNHFQAHFSAVNAFGFTPIVAEVEEPASLETEYCDDTIVVPVIEHPSPNPRSALPAMAGGLLP